MAGRQYEEQECRAATEADGSRGIGKLLGQLTNPESYELQS